MGAHCYQSVGHFCAWLLHRLFRDSIYFTPVVGAGGEVTRYRFGLVGCSDGDELADFLLDASIWIFSVLFAWSGSRRGQNDRYLQGALPFIGIQLVALIVVAMFPEVVTWLL